MSNENCPTCIHKNVCDIAYKGVCMEVITLMNNTSSTAKEMIDIKVKCREYKPMPKLSDEELLADYYEIGYQGECDERRFIAGFCRCGCTLYRLRTKAVIGHNPIVCPKCGYSFLIYTSKEY